MLYKTNTMQSVKMLANLELSSIFSFMFGCAALFCALFEFPIVGPVTSRKLFLVLCATYLFFNWAKVQQCIKRIHMERVVLFVFGMAICFLISQWNAAGIVKLNSNVYVEPYYYVQIVLYLIVFSSAFATLFKSVRSFAYAYILIMVLESIAVFVAAGNTSFRLFLYDNFYVGDDRFDSTIYWGTRIIGVYLHSSTGSLILAATCALLIYLKLRGQMRMIPFIFLYALIVAATFLIGRTGFYLEIALIVVYLLLEKHITKKIAIGIGITLIGAFVVAFVLSSMNASIADSVFSWATELFHEDTRTNTISTLASMEIPAFSPQMLLGTNIQLGDLPDGSHMGSDSGYAKTYCVIGVLGFFVYYASFIALLAAFPLGKNRRTKTFLFFLIAIAFLIEVKEPYFMKYTYSIFLLTLLQLSQKDFEEEANRD